MKSTKMDADSQEIFNGQLTQEQLEYLRNHAVSEKHIRQISFYLDKYKEYLSNYSDLVGDNLVPGKLFYFLIKYFGYLLETDPEKVLSKSGIEFRKLFIRPLLKNFGPFFLHSTMIIENRNELLHKYDPQTGLALLDKGIELPKEPVIWTLNHHFKDDALASVLAAKRHAYLFFGSMPQFYNTFDGILAYLAGTIMINRKNTESREAATRKAVMVLNNNVDLLVAPEGVLCKYPHHLLLKLWSGFYRIANETGAKAVPIVHYIYDPNQRMKKRDNPIHTVVDDPVDLTNLKGLSERAALDYYRDIMATWYYLMMEKYGQTTRDELLGTFKSTKEAWDNHLKASLKTVARYDSEIERSAHFQADEQASCIWQPIAQLEIKKYNAQDIIFARRQVIKLEEEDYQRRF